MSEDVDVSVIIVNYNSDDLLAQCLASIYKYSKGVSFEVIIVDNNSTVGNVEEVVKGYEGLLLIRNNVNAGFGAANNQGLMAAGGKYVLFLNNDTILIENAVKSVYEFAKNQESPAIVGCKILNSDKTLQKSVYDFPSLLNVITSNLFLYVLFPKSKYFNKYHLMNKQINRITEVDVVTGAFLLMERSAAIELEGFDERFFLYNEETDLCYRFKKTGRKVYYYPFASIIHLKGGSVNKNMRGRYKNEFLTTIQYFQKHFKGYKYHIAVLVQYLGKLIRIPVFLSISLITFDRKIFLRAYYHLLDLFAFPKNQFKN
jgi:GT2 family glycosyltransferase